MPRLISLFVLVLTLLFLNHCANREQPSSTSKPGELAGSAKSSVGSSSDCVGMGCDKPAQVPGVQGCVGMGCDKEGAKP